MGGEDDDINQILEENGLAAGKKKAEEALAATQAELDRALKRLDRQQLQISTLSGRGTAHKVASEEASRNGESWNIADVKRFSLLPQGPPDFSNDSLREMLDQALVGVDRRIRTAIAAGAKARADADRADSEGEADLEKAYSKCKEPAVEHAVRQASRSVLVRSTRCIKNLRIACQRLEEEAATAQSTHAADMRSLGARLVAQRDAITVSLLDELQNAETAGAVSISGLQVEISRMQDQLETREAEVGELRHSLADTQGRLKDEKIARHREYESFTKEVKTLKGEVARLSEKLSWTERDFATGNVALGAELAREEDERAEEARSHAARMFETTAEAVAAVKAAEDKLKALRLEARQMHHNMSSAYRELEEAKTVQDIEHANQMLIHENEASKERAFLRAKIDTLGKTIMSLRASSSRGRAMLYWSSMREKGELDDADDHEPGFASREELPPRALTYATMDEGSSASKPSLKEIFDAAWQQANPSRSRRHQTPAAAAFRRSPSSRSSRALESST